MKKKKFSYKVYTTGDIVNLCEFINENKRVNKSYKMTSELYVKNCFYNILYELKTNFRTLTREYLYTRAKIRDKRVYGSKFFESDDFNKIIHILFDENLDMMPLYINDPIIGFLATWRLKLGK